MLTEIQINTDMRYERKYLTSALSSRELESIVKLHKYAFTEIFYKRQVNNIYYDDNEMSCYYDNIDGSMNRKKYRIRWYGSLFGDINKPILEIKYKRGLLGGKKSFETQPFVFSNSLSYDKLRNVTRISPLPDGINLKMHGMHPTIVNHYERKYFQSRCGQFRITIDTNQCFLQIKKNNNRFMNKYYDTTNSILELKYDQHSNDQVADVTNEFKFRLTKSSKYVRGIELLNM